ncbi:hypothetical protein ZHAS_00021127 [Anopheles sinensis]|uniref:Uncharacterized protein n=1 Tax=Anopheles sinensis TaxID=74873 RepID=A0A084WRL0_ANOSI|nr:hypothetical protein ZHAS_00021127 [Anopheles sinensis]
MRASAFVRRDQRFPRRVGKGYGRCCLLCITPRAGELRATERSSNRNVVCDSALANGS